ncbi:molybdopterin cofactor-binding domain-containing protein [Nocardioides sp. MH1]|uniref:molybdopterin cofactor-binding domain-containing protein n=1 Tax=Nocardioides sp. MH1 TaxID=3242490 RepID=UPI0035222771
MTETRAPLEIGRRRVVGYLLAAPTLAVAVRVGLDGALPEIAGAVPTPPGPADIFDLNDLLTLAAKPTAQLMRLEVRPDGTAHFELPRSENGQGIVTSTAMIIAEELDLPVGKVEVTLSDARPELLFNQLTGGSNTTVSTWKPIRTLAAVARGRLLEAAAEQTGASVGDLRTEDGAVVTAAGRRISYASLAEAAAVSSDRAFSAELKDPSDFTVVGRPHRRTDALEAVTGRKQYTMDLQVPGALPTMICRPPTINGTVGSVHNQADVEAMPGVTHVAVVSTGVAVRAATFGQCIDAVRALQVDWEGGTAEGQSDADVEKRLKRAQIPLVVPKLPGITKTIDTAFTFWFATNSALETNCAIADVRADGAEIWGGMKSPITAQQEIAALLGMAASKVKLHVVQGGGSFGRKLFFDAALEAAEISQAMGVPVKLMWHRTDDFRQGRVHPMSTARVRATIGAGQVLTYEQRHTSLTTDFSHGLGEIITAYSAALPVGDIGFSQTVFELSQSTHYNFGVTTQLLNEIDHSFNTSSMRHIYSPNTAVARELTVDKIAEAMGKDPYELRHRFARNARLRGVLEAVAERGSWGRRMGSYRAQGLAVHSEYHSCTAALVEIDCRPTTVGRKVRDAVTGPRVTKVVLAVDAGLAVNPKGLEAQMMGGIIDGIALVLTSSLHLRDGYFLEGSWDNYAYTREWNVPFEVDVIVMPPTTGDPGGAGELAVAPSAAATATALARATGTMPTSFPVNHDSPLHFTVKPTVPPIPQSPVNGLTQY